MIDIWADIKDTGTGEKWRVRDLQQASSRSRINRGDGRFTLNAPAGGRNVEQLQNERIVTVYDGLGEFCSGYITNNNYRQSGTDPQVVISGESLLRELKWQRLDDIRIADSEWLTPPPRYHEHDFTSKWTSNRWQLLIDQYGYASCSLNLYRAIYVAAKSPIKSVKVVAYGNTSADLNSLAADDFYIEYYNGVQWARVGGLSYNGQPKPFVTQTTTFTYTFPSDMRSIFHDSNNNPFNDKESYFWIRLWPASRIEAIRVASVEVQVDTADTSDVTNILAEATGGWSLSGSYASGTANGTMQEFKGDSILGALIATTEKTAGEMFRKGDGRVIEWLNAPEDLELRLIGGRDLPIDGVGGNSSAALIASIDDDSDSSAIATRIYAYGRGTGTGRPDMSKARSSVVNSILTAYGFTLDTANNCIINTSLESTLGGQRPIEETFRDTGGFYSSGENSPQLSEEIVKQAAAMLYERREAKRTMKIKATLLPRKIKEGELVTVRYADGKKVILNEQFTVTEVKNDIARSGARTADLVLSNYNKPEDSPIDLLAKQIRANTYANRFNQTISGLSVLGAPPQVLG